MQSSEDQAAMRRYLLGESPQFEEEAIESRFFQDDDYFEQLKLVEKELIRDYLSGDIPNARRESFERKVLKSPALKKKVDQHRFTLGLTEGARNPKQFSVPLPHRLPRPLQFRPLVAFAMTLIIALMPALWLSRQNRILRAKFDRLETEFRRYNEYRKSVSVQPSDVISSNHGGIELLYSLDLSPRQLRGLAGPPSTVIIPRVLTKIRFRLNLDGRPTYESYRATIKSVDDSRLVWTQEGIGAQHIVGSYAAILELESSALPQADYVLTLAGQVAAGAWEPVEAYAFRVLKQ